MTINHLGDFEIRTRSTNADDITLRINMDDFETDIITRQRIVIEELLKAIHGYLNAIGTNRETDKMGDLREIYKQVSSASTMTGTTEE